MASNWGRKETFITPPTVPVYTFTAFGAAILCLCFYGWQQIRFSMNTLQRTYLTDYVRAAVGTRFNQVGKYRLIYLDGPGKVTPRRGLPVDFEEGSTILPDGRAVPVHLTALPLAQGYRWFGRSLVQRYKDASLYRWLSLTFYKGQSLLGTFRLSLVEDGITLAAMLYFAIPADIKRLKRLKYGRVLRGPEIMTPSEFHRAVERDFLNQPLARLRARLAARKTHNPALLGPGFKTTEMAGLMRIPPGKEAQHFQLMGDTGAGKTSLIMQLLRQIRDRGDVAVVNDPASEFVQRFFDEARGDVILNPLDARCPFWSPAMEMETNHEATTIAESLYQPDGGSNSTNKEFFYKTPAQIFAHLLKEGPTPHTLAAWMADESLLQKKVKGTEMAFYIDRKAGPQATGVLSSLGLVAQSLRLLPLREETTSTWNATDWAKKRKGWIFITSQKSQREVLRPLISLWIDILVMRLMAPPTPGQKQVWFVIDELASLQKLPQLHSAMTESRKSKNPLVVGFQGRAQMEDIYGKLAEVMLSQPATKIFMKTTEPKAAEWISETIGKVEIERLKETHFDGGRHGKNFTIDRQIEPLVMASEISGLDDRRAYLKLGNRVARFDFDYIDLPTETPDFIPRNHPGDKLTFDRTTLAPLVPPAPESAKTNFAADASSRLDNPTPASQSSEPPSEDAPQKGGAQHRHGLALVQRPELPITAPSEIKQAIRVAAADFLHEVEQRREALDTEGRDPTEQEVRSIRERWEELVERSEAQPEQTADPIMLSDIDPYLLPRHDHHQLNIF
jgi:hypothetical protein